MTKAKYQSPHGISEIKSARVKFEDLSVSLESLLRCREEKNQALLRIIRNCKNDDDIKRLKKLGLLKFENTAI